MSAYDDGRSDHSSSRYYDDRRHQRNSDYSDSRDNQTRSQVTSRDLIPRRREDSDYSVEEINRDFPPPTYGRESYRVYDDDRNWRSSRDRGHDHDYYGRHDVKKSRGHAFYEEEKKQRRVLSNQEKIMAAIIGGALAVGGKELYDRREAHQEGHDVRRNALSSAALGAAGALAAYQGAGFYNKHSAKEERKALTPHRGRSSRGPESEDNTDDEDPKESRGYKKFLESALAAAGLGGAVKALAGNSDARSDTRSHRSGNSRSRSGSRGGGATNKIQKAAMASLIAGATEAFRVAKEPGNWKGEKAKRIFTAAAGAATLDAAHDDKHSKLSLAQSVIGGLLGNRLVNGSRRNIEEDKRTGRSRSRSRARSDGGGGGVSGLAALATAGLGALGTKKLVDNHRSREREQERTRRRESMDSYDSGTGSLDRRHRSRSRSVVDTARRSLAKLGLGNEPERNSPDDPPQRKKNSSRNHRRYSSTDSHDNDWHRRGPGTDRGADRGSRSRYSDDEPRRNSSRSRHTRRLSRHGSDSDLGSSSEDEKQAKKMRDGHHPY